MDGRIVTDAKEKYDLIYKEGKKRKILLINPPAFCFRSLKYTSYSPLYSPAALRLGSFFKSIGCDVDVIDCMHEIGDAYCDGTIKCGNYENERLERKKMMFCINPKLLKEKLKSKGPYDEIYVTSVLTFFYKYVHGTIDTCKEIFPETPVYLGGIYATICPEKALESKADKIVVGEIKEINNYPLALELLERKPHCVMVKYTRGCPNNCSYCAVSKLEGNKMRYCPTETVVNQIKAYHDDYGIKNFVMWESNLLANAKDNFCKLMEGVIALGLEDVKFHFPEGIDMKLVTQDVADIMKKINAQTMRLALETVDPELNKRFHRATKPSDLDACISKFKKAGFRNRDFSCFLLIGLPKQSCQSIIESIAYVCKVGVCVKPLAFTPIPGTEEYEKHKNLIEGKDLEDIHPYTFPFANDDLKAAYLYEITELMDRCTILEIETNTPMMIRVRKEMIKDNIVLGMDELDNAELGKCPVFHFKINEGELNRESFLKIKKFIEKTDAEKVNFTISKPLPPCITGNSGKGEYLRFMEKYRFNTASGCGNCLHKHDCKSKDLKEVPKKCAECIYYKREQCTPCFFW